MNKNIVTNLSCALLTTVGFFLPDPYRDTVLSMGLFGLSGAITNWLAIHMLFERVPGLYGSGIIPLRFEAFKSAIHEMIMNQFFTREQIEQFIEREFQKEPQLDDMIENLDYDVIYDAFIQVVLESKFGGMVKMFGGMGTLESMRSTFKVTLRKKLREIVADPDFMKKLTGGMLPNHYEAWQQKIEEIVSHRLEELTPKMVKDIIQKMIRDHLGWLVVWGGVFGTLIGLITSFIPD